jgi:uncharacterized protein
MGIPEQRRRWWAALGVLRPWAPFWSRSWKHRAAQLALVALFGYGGILLVLLALENYFLFPALPASQGWEDPPPGLAVEDVWLTSADGTAIHAWFTAPPSWTPAAGALLYCHGNAGNLSTRGPALQNFQGMGLAVFIFDYPGYGKSAGQPSEAGCYASAEAAYHFLTTKKGVPGERVLLYGGSLGGAVAVELATRHPHRALILVATFTSFPDMAQYKFPWLPGRWFVRNQFLSLDKIATLRSPVFLAHGTADRVIPYQQGECLFAAAPGPKHFFPMHGIGHNDAPAVGFYEELQPFLAEKAPLPKV